MTSLSMALKGLSLTGVSSGLLLLPLTAEAVAELDVSDEISEQRAQVEVVQITGIRIDPTDAGLQLTLDSSGALTVPTPSVSGNALIADIPHAVLALPEGDRFEAFSPVAGIALVSATPLPQGGVRLAITGSEAPPVADISAAESGLTLAVSLGMATAPATDNPLRVVVTAEKTPEAAQDVPISLTVLTEQDIEDADISSFADIAANTPNFSTFSAGGNRTFLTYSIRGLSNASVLNRDAVAFYVDDIPYANGNFLNTNLPDLERVEILRGPQSTLYGRSSIGGVVNVVTRRPTNEFEFNGAGSYGNFDDLNVQAGVSGPLVEDELFVRLSGSYGSRDGYISNPFLNGDLGGQAGGNGRAQLLWTPSEDWEILITAAFDEYRDGASTFVPLNADPSEANRDNPGFNDLTANSQALRVSYQHPAFRFTSITARRYARNQEESDIDFSTVDELALQGDANSTLFSQEFRLQSPEGSDLWDWLLGGYFESRSFNIDSGIAITGVGLNLTESESDNQTLAFFGQTSYRLTEALTLTAGLRYESNTSTLERLDRSFTSVGGPTFPTGSIDTIGNDSDAWLPRFALEYRFSPEIMAYGSITRGYRPAGVNFQAQVADAVPFNAERSWNYEVGVKTSWLGDRLGVNLAIFHNEIDDFQVTFFNPAVNASFVSNAGASITGAELEVRATPIDGLDIIAGLGIVEGSLTNLTNPFTGVTSNASELLAAPDLTYNLAIQYRDPSGLFGRLELVGSGTTVFDEENTITQAPFALVNARLGYEFDHYGVYLFGNNLFNTDYITSGFTGGAGSVVNYGVPATYGIQVRAEL
ncbi:MAG: TonB-dependent receptor domain-containing protein [Leptolyngbyaceae cyanobacterium]